LNRLVVEGIAWIGFSLASDLRYFYRKAIGLAPLNTKFFGTPLGKGVKNNSWPINKSRLPKLWSLIGRTIIWRAGL
jgi:hypothetical protein